MRYAYRLAGLVGLMLLAARIGAEAFPTWIGVYGLYQRHSGGNPGTFTILMNQDYFGLQASVLIRVNDQKWNTYKMTYQGKANGNSLWRYTPAKPFPAGSRVTYGFLGTESFSQQTIKDYNGGRYYTMTIPAGQPNYPAEDYATPLDRGFRVNPENPNQRLGFIDFSVRNWEYDKKIAVNVLIRRQNGVTEEFLYYLKYKGPLAGGRERWGTDIVEIYMNPAWHGAVENVSMTYQLQADANGDGKRDRAASVNTYQLATAAELTAPRVNMGIPLISGANNQGRISSVDTDLAAAASRVYLSVLPPVTVLFSPYDHAEQAIRAEIDRVILAKDADPAGYHYIHAAVFDINDPRIVDKLIEAAQHGVDVKLLTAGYHMNPDWDWETEYARLQSEGIRLIGVMRDRSAAASMHLKFAVFDGQVVTTGSYNWETGSADDNCENLLVIRSAPLAAVYEDWFRSIAGEPINARSIMPEGRINVYNSQHDDVARQIYDEIEAAERSIHVAMFTLRSLEFVDDDGARKNVLDALVRAHQRGVAVSIILEENIAEDGEYFGTVREDDQTDEWLEGLGLEIIRVHTEMNGNRYASMHHKFAVIDGQVTLTGAYNWYAASNLSDDDLVVIRDPGIAGRYIGEHTNLRRHYDPGFDPRSAKATPVQFSPQNAPTQWGDTLGVVGDIPELGLWNPQNAVRLSWQSWLSRWTLNFGWRGSVNIPAGTHFKYKYVVLRLGGSVVWESGENREHTADPAGNSDSIEDSYWR